MWYNNIVSIVLNKKYMEVIATYKIVWVAFGMNEIMIFFSNMDATSWGILGVLALLLVILYINRSIPFVRELVENVIVEAEKSFNSGEGQIKLKYAVENIRAKLPFILRIFVTKSMVITLVEGTLKRLSATFQIDKDVDIKGNDSIFNGNKIKLDDDTLEVEFSKHKEANESKDGDTEMYGGVKVSTDWRDKPSASIEVGIKKKF